MMVPYRNIPSSYQQIWYKKEQPPLFRIRLLPQSGGKYMRIRPITSNIIKDLTAVLLIKKMNKGFQKI